MKIVVMAQKFIVPPEQEGQRLERWLKKILGSVPYSLIQKWLRLKRIRDQDGKVLRGNLFLKKGQVICIPEMGGLRDPKQEKESNFSALPLSQKKKLADKFQKMVVVQEKDFLIIAKPQGIATQGGTKQKVSLDTLAQAWSEVFNKTRPLIVHRLDKDTSGALLMALNRRAAQHFSKQLQTHVFQKEYRALVAGIPKEDSGEIRFSLEKSKTDRGERIVVDPRGREALSYYRVIKVIPKRKVAWLSLVPITGRMHQLRVHCAAAKFPIVGDWKYGGEKAQPFSDKKRLHLHSYRLAFKDLQGQLQEFSVPLIGQMHDTWTFLHANK
jgi:23S rRNA pseudouridine955/2504/2580 synthase